MDYYSLPRKQLQALCKKHGIPANSTNVLMADALTALLNGNGNMKTVNEGFQEQEPVSQDRGDDSVLTEVSNTPRRCTRSKRVVIAEEDKSAEEPVVIEIEETPVAPKGKGAKSANKTSERRPRTRTRSRKVLDVGIVNIDGSLQSSEVDESSDAVTALNSGKVKRSGPVKGSRNARTPKARSFCGTDGNEDLERLEDKQGSDEKEEKSDKTNGQLVEEAPKTRTKGRSSRKKIDKEDEAIEDSSIQGKDDASKNETTSICKRSTRARASKVVDAHTSQNRSSFVKKTGNAESIKKTPATVSKARRLKLSPMTENLTDTEEECDQAEEVVKVPTEKNLLANPDSSFNNNVKSSVRTRRALRSSQKDLNKDALEESASKVKRMPTRRGRNSVRNAHLMIGSETQEESNSESEGSDVKQERKSYRKITRKAVRKNLGKDNHKCTEEDKEAVENKAPEDAESIRETESEEMKCEITVQKERNVCQIFDQKRASSDISQTESTGQVENKSIAKISSRSSKDHQSTPINESYGSRIVKKLNISSGKVGMEQGIVSVGMTPLSRPVEVKLDSLCSVDQLGAQDSSCLKCSTDSMVAEESLIEKDAFTSPVDARVRELIGIEDGKVGDKMVNDVVNAAESHNGIRSVTMHVDFKGEEDAPFSHAVDFQKIEDTKEILHRNDYKMNNFNMQELQRGRDLSSSSAEAASPVEKKEGVMHSESNQSSIEVTQNLFEVQDKGADGEPGNVAILALNTSGEECLDPKAVYSSDLKIVGEQTELQLIPTNLVEETNQNTTEANLQDSSFFIDEVSDLEDAEEKKQDAQDSDFSFEVVSDVSHVQDKEVTGFTNGEGQVHEASEKIESGEGCQDVKEEILSDLDNTDEEKQDVQHSDLPFKVVSNISYVLYRGVACLANGEGQVPEASEKIESGEDCQDVEEEILSDLNNTEEENQDVQDSNISFKVASDISQIQDREVIGFGNAEGQVLEASEKVESDEDCQDAEEEILNDIDETKVENQDAQVCEHSFEVISNIFQVQKREVTGFANVESQDLKASKKVESGEACQNTEEGKLHALTSLPEETNDSAAEGKLDMGNTLPTEQSFEEESTRLGIAKQDQEASNDTVEGKHPSQSSVIDNVFEADPVKSLTASSAQSVGEVEIENFSFESDGKQKEADQAQNCSNFHPQRRSNTSCFAEFLVYSNVEDFSIAIQKDGTSDDDRTTIDKSRDRKLDVSNENSASRSDCDPLLCTKEETNMQNQISNKQVSPTAYQSVHNIDCLESDTTASMKSFETGNVCEKLRVEDTIALPVKKSLSGINIKESEFSVEASYEGKMPVVMEDTSFHDPQDACGVDIICEKINYISLHGASQELSSRDSPLALMEKAPNTLITDSRQQRKMLTDFTDGQNTVLNDGFQIAPLESERYELQIEKENPHQLHDLSLRKLRALFKEKKVARNNGQKEGERFVLRDLNIN